jgi:eukaryotic-like serine/threonine-protein kinase
MNTPSQIEAIFFAALERNTPEERAAYLEEACGGDVDLLGRVNRLLNAHPHVGDFLKAPAVQLADASEYEFTDGTGATTPRPGSDQPDKTRSDQAQVEREKDVLAFLAPSHEPGSLGRLDHYEVLAIVGSGGMGVVLKARDTSLQRVVAIKMLAPQMAASGTARKRFVREAQAAAAVRDEHVVSIHAVQGTGPIPYLVMEYIEGITLEERIKQRGPVELKEILRIGLQIAAGLAAAHKHGLVHRDVKPANILLENGVERVKITDFGLARAVDDASLSQSGVIAGTPMYMSPEQAEGQYIDQRSDLFSLGSVLYAMCAGHAPFRAPTTIAVLKRVCEDSPRTIRDSNADIPEWLEAVVARLHAKRPEDRFQSAKEAGELLGVHLAQLQNPSAGPREAVRKRSRNKGLNKGRRRVLAVAAALLVCLFGGLGLTEATGVTKVAATVIRILAPDGTLVVEVDDPRVSVSIDGEDMVITGAGAKEIRLKPGQYKVLARKDGQVVSQELVTVERNGRKVVRVSKESDAAPSEVKDKGAADRRAAEYVLSIGGKVGIDDQDGEIDAAADLPDESFRFTNLDLDGNSKVSDVGLAHCKVCKNLTVLNLPNTQVSDAGLANFKDCKNLTKLCLARTQVSDAGLVYFKDCKNLEDLGLGFTQVDDAGLAPFKDCEKLTDLNLGCTQVSGAGLSFFKDKNLTYLNLFKTQVGDAGLIHFKDCKSLTYLNLDYTQVSDVGLTYFKGCKDLTSLYLGNTQVGDAGLIPFKDCKNLTELWLQNTQVGDAGLDSLKDCKNLTYLNLQNTKVTAAGIDNLKKALPQCKIE